MLNNTIRFWESSLEHDRFLMDVSTRVFVEQTVKFLKELSEIKAKQGVIDGQAQSRAGLQD